MSKLVEVTKGIEPIVKAKDKLSYILETLIQFVKTSNPELLQIEKLSGMEEDVKNWKVGLSSDSTKDRARLMVIVGLLRKFQQDLSSYQNELKTSSINYVKENVLLPSQDLAKFINVCSLHTRLTGIVFKAQDDENLMKNIESYAYKILEPMMRNITNYMDVKEYVYRLQLAVEQLKQFDKELPLKDVIKNIQDQLKVLSTVNLCESLEVIEPMAKKEWKNLKEGYRTGEDILVSYMKSKEVDSSEVENTTIFKSIFKIVNDFNIVYDSYKNYLEDLVTVDSENVMGNYETGLHLTSLYLLEELNKLISKDADTIQQEVNTEAFIAQLERYKKLLDLLYDFDVNNYITLYEASNYVHTVGSTLYIISNILENILKRV